MIPTMTVSADKNPSYNSEPGNPTQDKVFLLSIPEANKYFSSDSTRQCKLTACAKEQLWYTGRNGFCRWWLRSPGSTQIMAAIVQSDGSVFLSGEFVTNFAQAVRPALWISLEP